MIKENFCMHHVENLYDFRTLQIVQREEYLTVADRDIIRRTTSTDLFEYDDRGLFSIFPMKKLPFILTTIAQFSLRVIRVLWLPPSWYLA